MLEIKNISKKYVKGVTEFTALAGVTFSMEKGDYVSVSGPSGSGKSTLLHVIGGLVRPDAGEVLYHGESIYGLGGKQLNLYRKREVGFIFQQFHLMPYLTVLENIRLSCYLPSHLDGISGYLERFSLKEMRNKYPSELSVGEKQRAAFIRAIISGPEIVLADEPTGNLDPGNSAILISLLDDFHKRGGTVLLVSHDPGVSAYSTRNITLEKGSISIPA